MSLLEVSDLRTQFYTEEGVVRAVDGLSYQIERGEKFGVVGESGAGKSVASLSLMRLIDDPGRVADGSIRFYEEEALDTFEADFPDRTVDVEALRQQHDLVDLVDRLLEKGASPSAIADDDRFAPDADARTIVRDADLDMRDIVDKRYCVDLGIVDEDECIVHDGDERYIEITRADGEPLRRLRGNHIAMIFQDPQTALNPVYTIGEQISEAIRTHMDLDDDAVRERTVDMLDRVGIPDPEDRYNNYPHEFSGGMQQRAVIAIALSCDPDLIIADEPTTALDVTIEAQILDLLDGLSTETGTAIQLITHDLGVVAGVCDRVAVMYAGKPVEIAPVEDLYYEPKHPYTVGLMGSIPRIGDGREELDTIPGTMPDLVEVPPGCSFHPRCPYAEKACTEKEPPLVDTDTGEIADPDDHDAHAAACLEYTGDLEQGLDYEVVIDEGLETGAGSDTAGTEEHP
ncbi:MAG: peptide/nickel transport system ATP-binding protein [Natronomonas sp.]|jgi:peptide/nickel transport system ATP-binding protein|uniref:ABC transporter ATP-binding protein n=1 Tax=Natronomonas sp. TaxID=2184060 RepID=UPI003988DA1E